MKNTEKALSLVLIILISHIVVCSAYSADYSLRRSRTTTAAALEFIEPLYLEQNFVAPEMREMLSDYEGWLKKSGRNNTSLSWMEFIKNTALNEPRYNLVSNRVGRSRLNSALSELISYVKNYGESKWASSLPDADKFVIVDKLIQKYKIKDEKCKLQLYRALNPGFRKWSWEDSAISKNTNIGPEMNDFLDKLQVLKLNDYSLQNRIEGLWELRWVYTNKNLPMEIRMRALDMVFGVLDTKIQDVSQGGFANSEVLWRNAREILREIFTAKRWNGIDVEADPDIWKPALERSLQAIGNANNSNGNYVEMPSLASTSQEFWSWWAITDALSSVKLDDNPELIKAIAYSGSSEIIRHVLASTLAYIKPTKYSKLRDEIIESFKERFLSETDEVWIESLGETLMKIGSPKVVEEMMNIAEGTVELAGTEKDVLDKKNWALRTVGETYYSDVSQLNKMRDRLFEVALYGETSKLRNTALGSVFKLRRHLQRKGVEFTPPDVEVLQSDKESLENNLVSLLPEDAAEMNVFIQELNKITKQNLSSEDNAQAYITSGAHGVYASVIKALIASRGAQTVTESLINSNDVKGSIEKLEALTEAPFEDLLGYIWERKADSFKWINPNLKAEFTKDGVLVVDGMEYSENLGFPRDLDKAAEVFRAEDGSMVMLKHADELSVLSEYIAHRLYTKFIEEIWGKDAGIGVSPLGLVVDPRDGRVAIVSAMVSGYKKGTKFLSPEYLHDERLQSIIAPALVLGDGTRTPKGFLFAQRDFEQPLEEGYKPSPDYLMFNYGALLSAGGMGFKPYNEHFEITDGYNEFEILTHSSHTGMKGDYANEAWGELINGQEQKSLIDVLMNLDNMQKYINPVINQCMNEFSTLTGHRFGEDYTIQAWSNQIKSENVFGRWNLAKEKIRGTLLNGMFGNILKEGNLRYYLTAALAARINEVMKYLGYTLEGGD